MSALFSTADIHRLTAQGPLAAKLSEILMMMARWFANTRVKPLKAD
jgi:hypothetical protein